MIVFGQVAVRDLTVSRLAYFRAYLNGARLKLTSRLAILRRQSGNSGLALIENRQLQVESRSGYMLAIRIFFRINANFDCGWKKTGFGTERERECGISELRA